MSYASALKCTLIKVNTAGEEAGENWRDEKLLSVAVGGDQKWQMRGSIKVVPRWVDDMLEGAAHTEKISTFDIHFRKGLQMDFRIRSNFTFLPRVT